MHTIQWQWWEKQFRISYDFSGLFPLSSLEDFMYNLNLSKNKTNKNTNLNTYKINVFNVFLLCGFILGVL